MHSKTYKIVINKPVSETFLASLNPKNTPQWIDGMAEEQSNEFPPKLGTKYRNRGQSGGWSDYTITAFEQDKTFTLSRDDGAYHVKYTFRPVGKNQTEFEYSEWEDSGELKNPLPEEAIQKLKLLIENQP